jgi:hypothetical protein
VVGIVVDDRRAVGRADDLEAPAGTGERGEAVRRRLHVSPGQLDRRERSRGVAPVVSAAGAVLRSLGDLGYEGESENFNVGFKKPKQGKLSVVQQQFKKVHNGLRAFGERGNSLLKMTFRALRNVSLDPWRIGNIVAAALVLLHIDHGRTT